MRHFLKTPQEENFNLELDVYYKLQHKETDV